MDMIGKGSKPVLYKSNIRLRFYSTTIEDSKVRVNNIFTKVADDGKVIVYGEYIIYLLYSYFNSQNQKIYMTETQAHNFSETLLCRLPSHFNATDFIAEAAFDPRITFKRASNSAWNIEIEGQIDVFVYGSNDAISLHSTDDGKISKQGAKVTRIENTNLSVDELLEMDADMLQNLSSDVKRKSEDDQNKKE